MLSGVTQRRELADRDGYVTLQLPHERIRLRVFRKTQPKLRSAKSLQEERRQRVKRARMRDALMLIEYRAQVAEVEKALEELAKDLEIVKLPDGTYQSLLGYGESIIGSHWERYAPHHITCKVERVWTTDRPVNHVRVAIIRTDRRARRETLKLDNLLSRWKPIAT